MKARIGSGALALALMLTGCGGGGDGSDGNLAAAAANGNAPLPQIAAPNSGDWREAVAQTDEGYLMGNPDAPVKLVEYASMTCPHCARFSAEATRPLRDTYIRSGQVSWEFRNFILNAPDAAVSILTRCLPPGAFFRTAEQLFEQQQEWMRALDPQEEQAIGALPPAQQLPALGRALDMDTFFARRGMPESQFNQCLNDQQAAERLAEMNRAAAERHGIRGTPTFLINGETQDVSDWRALEPRLRAAIGG